jgi:hypothetical protein
VSSAFRHLPERINWTSKINISAGTEIRLKSLIYQKYISSYLAELFFPGYCHCGCSACYKFSDILCSSVDYVFMKEWWFSLFLWNVTKNSFLNCWNYMWWEVGKEWKCAMKFHILFCSLWEICSTMHWAMSSLFVDGHTWLQSIPKVSNEPSSSHHHS